MEAEGLEFLQFSFRWVNCLLLREIPFHLGLRLWDTYLAEGPRMKEFLIYVLAAFLLTWEKDLKQMDFQVRKHHHVHVLLCTICSHKTLPLLSVADCALLHVSVADLCLLSMFVNSSEPAHNAAADSCDWHS